MGPEKKINIYAQCKHIKRTIPDSQITEEIAKEICSNYIIIPDFEQRFFDHVSIEHYSLQRNELLRCRWTSYKMHFKERVFEPYQFPNLRDLHFYNCAIRFLPSESIHRHSDHRMKLKAGPGVDFRGPIPQETKLKRWNLEKREIKKKREAEKK